jgi:hypothetical protein
MPFDVTEFVQFYYIKMVKKIYFIFFILLIPLMFLNHSMSLFLFNVICHINIIESNIPLFWSSFFKRSFHFYLIIQKIEPTNLQVYY